jgi:Protein of unknown function (DUF1592)/Protein of unknown function (DUF1588)/Protein of unknown function (DUF1595)/Protein of unknown function (DUF1585)/Protein of unknown function (DUF1587)
MMRRKQQHALFCLLGLALAGSACAGRAGGDPTGGAGSTGNPGSGGSSGTVGTGSGGTVGTGSAGTGGSVKQPPSVGLALFTDTSLCAGGQVDVGSTPLRRLSRIEYNNMVRDLGLDPSNTQPANQFVSEQKIDGNFNTNSYASISGTIFNQQYLQAAETLAANAVANNLSSLVTCTTQDAACATQFITSFAGRAFRGQLDTTESAALLTLYNNVRAAPFDFPTGIQAIITSVLTSPHFLFVLEFGQPPASGTPTAIPLTPMELATRLSLYLWRSLPDQTLITAANGGHLVSASDVATQASRMLADPKATAALHDFADQWLDIENMDGVTKDTQFVNWTAGLAEEMHMETLTTFTSTVLAATKNGLGDLLTSGSSYVNTDLAGFYNNPGSYKPNTAGPGVASDYKSTAVGTASSPRMGVLTDGSVLAIHSHTSLPSPTKRGRMIRQQILCEQISNPPAAVGGVPIPPPPTAIPAGQTTRSQYLQHVSANGVCNGCHQYMDWLGFGFDNYDATGAFITTENGTPVDSSGKFIQMPAASDIGGTFTGTTDMITQLSASPQVDQCYTLEQIRYSLGRVESKSDACSAQQIYQTFSTNSFNLRQLLIAVVSSNSFMYRTPVNAGGACQ